MKKSVGDESKDKMLEEVRSMNNDDCNVVYFLTLNLLPQQIQFSFNFVNALQQHFDPFFKLMFCNGRLVEGSDFHHVVNGQVRQGLPVSGSMSGGTFGSNMANPLHIDSDAVSVQGSAAASSLSFLTILADIFRLQSSRVHLLWLLDA